MLRLEPGDATDRTGLNTPILIVHIVNSIGVWGKGFTAALDAKSDIPRKAYFDWYRGAAAALDCSGPFGLGEVQTSMVDPNCYVANMVAQEGVGAASKPIRYGALLFCLNKVRSWNHTRNLTILMPKIGAGLAGGSWSVIQPLIEARLSDRYDVVVRTGSGSFRSIPCV